MTFKLLNLQWMNFGILIELVSTESISLKNHQKQRILLLCSYVQSSVVADQNQDSYMKFLLWRKGITEIYLGVKSVLTIFGLL